MLSATLPLFVLIGLGYLLASLGVFKQSWVKALNGFVYYVSLPAVIFASITTITGTQTSIVITVLYNLLISVVFAAVAFVAVSLVPATKRQRAAMFLTAIMSNTVYLGVPLVHSVFGGSLLSTATGDIALAAIIQLLCSVILALLAIEFIFLRSRNWRAVTFRIGKNPVLISTVVALVCVWLSLQSQLPTFITDPLTMLALTATPLALLALGAFLHHHHVVKHAFHLILTVGIKLVVLPVLVMAIALIYKQPVEAMQTALLLAGMPVAITAFVLAEEYKLETQFVALAMLTSTILSLVTLNILILYI